MAESLASSKSLRAGLSVAGKVTAWDMDKRSVSLGYNPHDVQIHCVKHSAWQAVRLSMKGKDTTEKLSILEAWWDGQMNEATRIFGSASMTTEGVATNMARANALKWATEVQVGNYLGALRRGGQLDNENRIRKAR